MAWNFKIVPLASCAYSRDCPERFPCTPKVPSPNHSLGKLTVTKIQRTAKIGVVSARSNLPETTRGVVVYLEDQMKKAMLLLASVLFFCETQQLVSAQGIGDSLKGAAKSTKDVAKQSADVASDKTQKAAAATEKEVTKDTKKAANEVSKGAKSAGKATAKGAEKAKETVTK